jgi:hypothetical protein
LALISSATASKKPPPLPHFTIPPPPVVPTTIGAIKRSETLAVEYLHDLDVIIAGHPQLEPYREQIWNTAMLSRSGVLPGQLAGLIYCAIYAQQPCRVVHGVLQ